MAMKINSIKYYFKEGFTGLFKNRLMTIASIATVAACILIMTFSYCIINNLKYVLIQLEDSVGIAVFLDDNLLADDINSISTQIEKIDHVNEVTYISPDEALSQLKQDWNADDILSGFDSENNPLSHSFEIKLDGIQYQNQVLDALNGIEGIRNIRHAQSETEILMKLNSFITILGALVILILGVISVVIIMNTIKISVYTRKTEINIMKFVGATDWFIRWPFIIEGMLIGLIGAIIPIIIAWPIYGKVINMMYENFSFIKNMITFRYSVDIFSVLMPAALIAGVLLGVIGSITSIRKYLKV